MNLVDLFNNDLFSTTSLTAAIRVVPNQYDRVGQLGMFQFEGVNTTSVVVEIENGVLNLLPTKPRNGGGSVEVSGKRTGKSFLVPHIPHEGKIMPDEIQGVRQFGTVDQLESVANVTNRKLMNMANKHYQTWEYHRAGAVSGVVLDADGSTLFNWFTEFGVAQQEVNFVLGTDTTDVQVKCLDVSRIVEDNLLGDRMDYVHCLASQTWFDKFVKHPVVKEAWKWHLQVTAKGSQENGLANDPRKGFWFAGILFEEYRGRATVRNADGSTTTRKFIAEGDARFFPVGTTETFRQWGAPANWVETVNTQGIEMYAKATVDPRGRWVDLDTESNPLFMCMRPGVLVRGHSSN